MTTPPAPDAPSAPDSDASRRTWLAAERTWLAWWRTGLGATAVAIGVGRLLPGLSSGTRWPYVVVGLGYGALAVSILIVGAARQRRVAESLRRGGYDHLSDPLVVYMTAAAVVLAIATLALVVVAP